MMKKHVSEILLTTNYVTKNSWLDFIFAISKLNGLFKKFNIYVYVNLNNVRYFIESKNKLPPIINSLGDFLLKEIEVKEKIISFPSGFCFIKNNEHSIIDIYDKHEVKHSRKLKISKISILPYKKNNFLYMTHLFFETKKYNILKKTAFLNIPHEFLSIDFSTHNRFFYTKDAIKYLDIQKSLHLFTSDSKDAILNVDTFPYLPNNYYLHPKNYDFDRHSMIIGSSGTGKSKLISSLVSTIATNNNYSDKYKVVIIDPHAALENDIGGLKNTNVIDFKSIENSLDLFINNSQDAVSSTELILSLFKTLIADQYNSRLERVLRHSIHLLTLDGSLNFTNLRNLILNSEYRTSLIKKHEISAPLCIIEFFLSDFSELKNKSYQEAISPIVSFIDEMQLLPAFNSSGSMKNIKESIDENFLTIFSLDQTSLGETITKTISRISYATNFAINTRI